ncbi:hypothetical protein EG329_000407 [Mollisiaceae sp. DMI_Dod_QoI]|nr:hypothetical protein EG329_000407 [Helotiales sp. DMI_Dod_QoI]
MDGLSAAASGIAVVSLAIQLVDSVREIQRFLRSIADAAEELNRLVDLLEQLELILQSIGKLVEHQRAQHGDLDIDVSPSILKSVQTCEKTLQKLNKLIEKVKHNAKAKGRVTRALGHFWLGCKKEDIEDFENQLHRSVSNLNLIMTTNLIVFHSHGMQKLLSGVAANNSATTGISQELVALRMEVATDKYTPSNVSHARTRKPYAKAGFCRRPGSRKVVYKGILGVVTARIYAESDDIVEGERSRSSYARDERSWIIIPSFFSCCVQVHFTRSFGSVERTLRVYLIIPDHHPVWSMCYEGDVPRIQQLFSNREISPYSVNSGGVTLLSRAAEFVNTSLCILLLDLGVKVEPKDASLNPGIYFLPGHTVPDRIEHTYKLCVIVNPDMDLADFCSHYFYLIGRLSIQYFRSKVHYWVTEENINLFEPSPLAVVIKRMCDLSIDQEEFHKWKEIGSYLVAKKADIHKVSYWQGHRKSLIEIAWFFIHHPFDSSTIGMRLLETLDAGNVELGEYLRVERQYYYRAKWLPGLPFVELVTPRLRVVHIADKEPFSLSWDWWIDPEGVASEVLHEFRHFGPVWHDIFDYKFEPTQVLRSWPFMYPFWSCCLQFKSLHYPGDYERKIADRFKTRFERRWQKKMTKLAKIQGTYKKPKMPGMWID